MRYHVLTAEVIRLSGKKARQFGHSYVGSAHLLAALAAQPAGVGQLLRSLGVDTGLTDAMTQLFYGAGTPGLPLPQGLSPEARAILRGAAGEAKAQKSREIRPVHVLLALSRREDSRRRSGTGWPLAATILVKERCSVRSDRKATCA